MANTSCSDSYSSLNDLLTQVDSGEVNITAAVSACQAICTMAWGSGSPELSGIGLIVCYMFQAALTICFGVPFFIFYRSAKFTPTNRKQLEELHDIFLDINAQLSVPIAIAAIVRLHQDPPFYEVDFMNFLTVMQFLSLLATTATVGMLDQRKSPTRFAVICLYSILELVAVMMFLDWLQTTATRLETIDKLATACKTYGSLLPGFEATQNITWPHRLAKLKWLLEHKAVVIQAFVCLCGVVIVGSALWYIFLLERMLRTILLGLVSVGLNIWMIDELLRMMRARAIIQSNAESGFADDAWGFGQVVALFLWVPFCAQGICLLYQLILYVRRRRTPVTHVEC